MPPTTNSRSPSFVVVCSNRYAASAYPVVGRWSHFLRFRSRAQTGVPAMCSKPLGSGTAPPTTTMYFGRSAPSSTSDLASVPSADVASVNDVASVPSTLVSSGSSTRTRPEQ